MRLAYWDFPPTECVGIAARSLGIEVEVQSASKCEDLLSEQQIDLALLPVTVALNSDSNFDIVPGGAVSSWAYPFAKIRIHHDLYQASSMKSASGQMIEEFMAKVILKEHYGLQVRMVSEGEADLELLSTDDFFGPVNDQEMLDLGQEWYELAHYPMVWGLYCCLKGTGTDAMIHALIELTKKAELVAQDFGLRSSAPKDQFFGESLRLRLDDVTIAGLTAIQDYMYYYGLTSELQAISILKSEQVEQVPWWGEDTGLTVR